MKSIIWKTIQHLYSSPTNVLSTCVFNGEAGSPKKYDYTVDVPGRLKKCKEQYPGWRILMFYYPDEWSIRVKDAWASDITDCVDITSILPGVSGTREQARCWRFLAVFCENINRVRIMDLDDPMWNGIAVSAVSDQLPDNRFCVTEMGLNYSCPMNVRPVIAPYACFTKGLLENESNSDDFSKLYDIVTSSEALPYDSDEKLMGYWYWKYFDQTCRISDNGYIMPPYKPAIHSAYTATCTDLTPLKRRHVVYCCSAPCETASVFLQLKMSIDSLRRVCPDVYVTLIKSEYTKLPNMDLPRLQIDQVIEVPAFAVPGNNGSYYKLIVPFFVREPCLVVDTDTFFLKNPSELFEIHRPPDKLLGMCLNHFADKPEGVGKCRYNSGVLMVSPLASEKLIKTYRKCENYPLDNWEETCINTDCSDIIYKIPYKKYNNPHVFEDVSDSTILHFYNYIKTWDNFCLWYRHIDRHISSIPDLEEVLSHIQSTYGDEYRHATLFGEHPFANMKQCDFLQRMYKELHDPSKVRKTFADTSHGEGKTC